MANIPLPSIRFGKRKDRSQMCEIFTDDGQIKQIELEVNKSCVDDPDKGVGFLLDADDQFMCDDRHWYQLLYEKSCLPICLIGDPKTTEETLKTTLNQIFDESQEAAKEQRYIMARKNQWAERVTLIVALLCGSAVIFFAIQTFGAKSG